MYPSSNNDFLQRKIEPILRFMQEELGIVIPSNFRMPEIILSSEEKWAESKGRSLENVKEELYDLKYLIDKFDILLKELTFEETENAELQKLLNLVETMVQKLPLLLKLRWPEDTEYFIREIPELIALLEKIVKSKLVSEYGFMEGMHIKLIKSLLRLKEAYAKRSRTYRLYGLYDNDNIITLYVANMGYTGVFLANLEATFVHELFHAIHKAAIERCHGGNNNWNKLSGSMDGKTVIESLARFVEFAWCIKGASIFRPKDACDVKYLRGYARDREKEAEMDAMGYVEWPYAGAYGLIKSYGHDGNNNGINIFREVFERSINDFMGAYSILDEVNQEVYRKKNGV